MKKQRKNSFPSIIAAEQRYKHGTHARYVLARCRCGRCRNAAVEYEQQRQKKRRPTFEVKLSRNKESYNIRNVLTGRIVFRSSSSAAVKKRANELNSEQSASTELIPVDEVVRHIRWLQDAGIGVKTIGRASTVSQSVLNRMLEGDIRRTRRSTAAKVLRIKPENVLRGGARMRADETFVLIARLEKAGYRRGWIAMQLGAATPTLQIAKTGWVSVKKAREVHALYERTARKDRSLRTAPPFRIGEAESSLARHHGQSAARIPNAKPQARPHGTAAGFDAGCQCMKCVRAKERAAKAKASRLGTRYVIRPVPTRDKWIVADVSTGTVIHRSEDREKAIALRDSMNAADPVSSARMLVDATPVRRHLRSLASAGATSCGIALAAGISSAQVQYLMRGQSRRTANRNAKAIMSLRPGELPTSDRIDAAASWAMLDRMLAAGFDHRWIVITLNLPESAFAYRGKTIALDRARDLLVLYESLRECVPILQELENAERHRYAIKEIAA
jgi:hypothetical protein